ncbi:hypothetical protein ACHAQA_002199 [Verticillium albo-atrum]
MMPMTALNFLSPDGRSFSFDARANGYGRGEGVGFVILKRLSDALRDNDPIRAVIRGTNINQDGRTLGIVYPSKAAQVENITSAYKKCGLGFEQTAYVECHGTGTKAGDLVELTAVAETLAAKRLEGAPIMIGSVKPNIGHLEGAAGIAGLIKGVLVLEKAEIPPQANFETGNPRVKFQEWNLKVPIESCSWPLPGLRRVSVNCFGFGGTNAHAIMDEGDFYQKQHFSLRSELPTPVNEDFDQRSEEQVETSSPQLFTFTSPNQRGVLRVMQTCAEHVLQSPKYNTVEDFSNLAYTLNFRRSQFEWKGFVVATTQTELAQKLSLITQDSLVRSSTPANVKVAFLFGGQGAQFAGMGQDLLCFPAFRDSLEAATEYLQRVLHSRFDLWEEIMKHDGESAIQKPQISQPATTAIQIGLVDLMKAFGVKASSAVGHSSGEIAAAYASGIISREDAWTIAFYRGLCADQLTGTLSLSRDRGMMCAVSISEADMRSYLRREGKAATIQVACINSPRSVTVSGDAHELFDMSTDLKGKGIFHRILDVQVAYHSHHMQSIKSEYKACLQDLPMEFYPPSGLMFSSVTGGRFDPAVQTSKYWTDNLVSPVLFADAMAAMVEESRPDIILELGPHGTMKGHVDDILNDISSADKANPKPNYLSAMTRGVAEARSVLSTLGALWSRGCDVDMQGLCTKDMASNMPKTLHDLPTYPWDHSKKFWHESPLTSAYRFREHGRQDLLGEPTADSVPLEPRWRGFLRVHENPWIKDHQVQKTIVYPAAGIIAMVVEGVRQHMKDKADEIAGLKITDMTIQAPMIVPEDRYGLETSLNARQLWQQWHTTRGMSFAWTVYARVEKGTWIRHAHGEVHCRTKAEIEERLPSGYDDEFELAELGSTEIINIEHMYEMLDIVGMNYGPAFRNITSMSKSERTCVGRVTIPDTKSTMPHSFEFEHLIHPATLDAIFQLLLAIGGYPMVPTTIESIYVSTHMPKGAGQTLFGYGNVVSNSPKGANANVTMTVDNWVRPTVVVKGLHLDHLTQTGFLPSYHNLCSEIQWQQLSDTANASHFSDLLQLMAHQYPYLSILQCGGDKHMAKHILNILSSGDGYAPRLARFSLTGSDDSIFLHLQKVYSESPILDILEHRTLSGDVNTNPKYHLIVSAAGQHNLDDQMKLLRPGGMILCRVPDDHIVEEYDGATDKGTLPVFMNYKVNGCSASAHFCGIRAQHNRVDTPSSTVFILVPNSPDRNLRTLADHLADRLHEELIHTAILTLQQLCPREPAEAAPIAIISLLDLKKSTEGTTSFVWNWDAQQFEGFRTMRSLANKVLWVTCGANKKSTQPENATIIGLARTLLSEDPEKAMVTLDLDEASLIASSSVVSSIFQVFVRSILQPSSDEPLGETEYAESDGKLFIPRLIPVKPLNDLIQDKQNSMEPVLGRFLDARLNELKVKEPGKRESNESYCFVSRDAPHDKDCAPDEVKVQFRASVLQYSDWETMGGATGDTAVGIDLAGTVMDVGSNVKKIHVNDQVVAVVLGGSFKNTHYIDQLFVKCIPAGLQKCVPSAWIPAYYGLIMRCHITKDKRVLIHHGLSLPGQAAIQIAQAAGAEVYTTISGRRLGLQRKLLAKNFGLDSLHIYNSDDPCWGIELLRRSEQAKMDIVYNPGPKNLCDTQSILKSSEYTTRPTNPSDQEECANTKQQELQSASLIARH